MDQRIWREIAPRIIKTRWIAEWIINTPPPAEGDGEYPIQRQLHTNVRAKDPRESKRPSLQQDVLLLPGLWKQTRENGEKKAVISSRVCLAEDMGHGHGHCRGTPSCHDRQLYRREEGAARRNPGAEEGMEMLQFRMVYFNSCQQQRKLLSVSWLLKYSKLDMRPKLRCSERMVSHTGHRRLVPLPHKAAGGQIPQTGQNSIHSCCTVSAKTSTTRVLIINFLSVARFSCAAGRSQTILAENQLKVLRFVWPAPHGGCHTGTTSRYVKVLRKSWRFTSTCRKQGYNNCRFNIQSFKYIHSFDR